MPDRAYAEATTWSERYRGGSPEAERRAFERLAERMLDAQLRARKTSGSAGIERAAYPGTIAALKGGGLRFAEDLPQALTVGFAEPGAEYPATVRFSNAGHGLRAEDMRGVAVRIEASATEHHDLLATNWPASHARDADQFVRLAFATTGGAAARGVGLVRLIAALGPREAARMFGSLRAARRPCASVALETYWSCGAIAWGGCAVRYVVKPAAGAPPPYPDRGRDRLAREFVERLRAGDVAFDIYVQPFVEERITPIEDAAQVWREDVSPPVRVATLTLPRQDLDAAEAQAERRAIDAMGFNPWNTTDEFRPLGNLNRARKAVYDASLAHRTGKRWRAEPLPLHNRMVGGAARVAFRAANRIVPWHRMPLRLSLLNLDALRHDMRARNLIDAEPREAPPRARSVPDQPLPAERLYRTYDGRANDLSDPGMGAVGAAFGRNMPLAEPAADEPNAVLVAREFLDRRAFIPARTLNVLAAAWIQFQVHDWVAHARRRLGEADHVVPIPEGHPDWANATGGATGREMRIAGNVPHPTAEPWVFANAVSHWWDGSDVYGSSAEHAATLREGARLRLDEGYLPTDLAGQELTGFNESWWSGLSVMHTLFAREHNVLVDELQRAHPGWDDERTYQTARLIVSALIAKIHTVEWTPAILGTRALDIALEVNWCGPRASDWMTRLGVWLTDVHAMKGITSTFPDHHGVPYALTEEFVTVYRMHPLIPDDYVMCDFATGRVRESLGFAEMQGDRADDVLRRIGLRDALYSFGIAHPGAITLHNFPRALQVFEREGEIVDLSVADIVRTRARRVPRYNAFRRALGMPEVTRWQDLTADRETNERLRAVYGRIDDVDTVIGLLGENPPRGFGFSDTAFRIFLLMASRRLQSDRFLTVDFRPEIYSALGMDWIERNTMKSVILRHCPELASVLPREGTAFAPWRTVS